MRKYVIILTLTISLLLVMIFGLPFDATSNNEPTNIYISEVMVSNRSIYSLEGESYDFIELHNNGQNNITLLGYGLTDDAEDPFKWTFPNITIEPDGYLIVWASGLNKISTGNLHTNFSIKSGKEAIVLTASDGTTLSELTPEATHYEYSYGYHTGINQYVWMPYPTPGEANSSLYVTKANRLDKPAEPVPSHPSGFYESGISLKLTSEEEGIIYYTLDGSLPNEHSMVYEGPIWLDETTNPNDYAGLSSISYMTDKYNPWGRPVSPVFKGPILRAAVYEEGKGLSDIVTRTFFIDENIEERYHLPIVSLITDPDNFFDYEKGIYVTGKIFDITETKMSGHSIAGDTPANYTQRGPAWERPVNFSYFSPSGELLFNQDIGIRIHGAWSRANPQKGLRLFADDLYGDASMAFPFFEGLTGVGNNEPINEFSRLLIRAHGNDWSMSLFRDPLMQYLIDEAPVVHGLDTQSTTPAVVFINGEYWGIHNIRETLDEYKLGSHYGIEPEDISILEFKENKHLLCTGNEQSAEDYTALMSYAEMNDLDVSEHYNHMADNIDLNNYMLYMATQTYYGNMDWPGNNIRYWRKEITGIPDDNAPFGHDGRWRYILYDTDFGFYIYEGMQNSADFNSLAFVADPYGPEWPNPPESTKLFRNLIKSTVFREDFVATYCNLLNTTFKPDFVHDAIDFHTNRLTEDIPEHHNRYNHLGHWDNEIARMNVFATERYEAMWAILENEYNLGNRVQVSIGVNDSTMGSIHLNQFDITKWSNSFEGYYFDNIPLDLEAVANEGYQFVGWTMVEDTSSEITVYPENNMVVTALFETVN